MILVGAFVASKMASAQDDPELQAMINGSNGEATSETRKLLLDKDKRKAFIETDQKASEVDKRIYSLTKGSETMSQEVYSISADVFSILAAQSGGDPIKMQALLEKAKADPQGFMESLSPEVKNQIRGLAGQIEMKNGGSERK